MVVHDPRSDRPRMTLTVAVCGYVILTTLAVIAGAFLLFFSRADRLLDASLNSAVQLRMQAAAANFARALHDDWSDLDGLADRIPSMSDEGLRGLMDGLRGDGRRIAWIGFADVRGEVQAASGGLLEGEDVSAELWFRNGLRGDHAGDLHEAELLASVLPAREDAGPLQCIDLARPVRNSDGEVTGVAFLHLDFSRAEAVLREQATALGIDLYLITSAGKVILASNGDHPSAEELSILRTARLGAAAERQMWPDGREYFASRVSRVGYDDLPSFGWRLVGRLDADAFRPGLRNLKGSAVVAGLGLLAILAAATGLFLAVYVRPLARLGEAAEHIAEGQEVYPPESKGTREAAQISAALARLQNRRPSGLRSD